MSITETMSGSMLLAIVSLLVLSASAYVEPTARYRQDTIYPEYGVAAPGFAAFFRAPGPHAFLQPVRAPAAFAGDLFAPNAVQQPAETPGQLENYRRALQEDARAAERAQNSVDAFAGLNSAGGAAAPGFTSYVDVNVEGGKGYNYGYAL